MGSSQNIFLQSLFHRLFVHRLFEFHRLFELLRPLCQYFAAFCIGANDSKFGDYKKYYDLQKHKLYFILAKDLGNNNTCLLSK